MVIVDTSIDSPGLTGPQSLPFHRPNGCCPPNMSGEVEGERLRERRKAKQMDTNRKNRLIQRFRAAQSYRNGNTVEDVMTGLSLDHQTLCHSDGSVCQDGCDKLADPEILEVYKAFEDQESERA